MRFTVEELHGDWHVVGTTDALTDNLAVERCSHDAGLYRVRENGTRAWHYFWLPTAGRPEPMDD